MNRRSISLLFLTFLLSSVANAYDKIIWPNYADEVVKIFEQHGGKANAALYSYFDYDNDGQEELIVYQYGASEDNSHVCVFCANDQYGLQLVKDSTDPWFYYKVDGEGAYTIVPKGNSADYVMLKNSVASIDDPGIYGDGDNLCLQFHGRRDGNHLMNYGKPLLSLKDGNFDMTPYKGEIDPLNFNLYWYRNQPKVKGGVGVVPFFKAICDAINMPQLKTARQMISGEEVAGITPIIDSTAGYIKLTKKALSPEAEQEDDIIECTYWHRKDGKHIVALHYRLLYSGDIGYGTLSNLLFWVYDPATSTLTPVTEPYDNLWSIPNLNYNIRVDLPHHGRDIKMTDMETGEQYRIVYHEDEDLITFTSDSRLENTNLIWQKGLLCSIYDTSGTPANIRIAPKGKKSEYSVDTSSHGNIVVTDLKDGYYRIVDNKVEFSEDDCDNTLYMDDNASGYWIHTSCIAVKSRHNDGAPLKLYKDWTDCDEQPVTYTITSETKLRPIAFSPREGWVKVQTLDGKHSGWVTKDKLAPLY